jgi:hypothetical protein
MQIKLTNCLIKFQNLGIDINNNDNVVDELTSQFNALMPTLDWSYDFQNDITTISVPDNTIVPDGISDYGDVMTP